MTAETTAVEALFATVEGMQRTVSRLPSLLAAHADLPATRLTALGRIALGEAGVTDVADATMLSVSAASRTVDALVEEGLVDRSRDPRNRRSVVLSLTADGEALTARLREHFVATYLEPVTERLGADRTHEIAAALDDLVAAFAAHLDDLGV